MRTLLELVSAIEHLGPREAVRWSNGFRTWTATYERLYAAIGAIANEFDKRQLQKGDRVLLWAENRMEWMAAFWACVARGIEAVPVDYRFSEDLVHRIEGEARPKLTIDNALLDRFSQLAPISTFTLSDISPDDVVEIVYTSGTTGDPKGVVHRHRNICANLTPFQNEITKYKKWMAPFQPIRILDLLPLSHMFGQTMGLFMPVLLQGSTVLTTEIHPDRIIRMVHDHRITVLVCVPRILENLKAAIQRGHSTFLSAHSRFGWKFWAFVVGGARLDPDLEEFWTRLRFAVVQGYGLTEASPVVAVNHPFHPKRGSLGKPVQGQDVRIAPDGEILVRGESVTTDAEWLHTGDLGEIDAEGRLYFRGRKKEMIVTPEGLNVHPDDVETVLNSFPEIRASTVIGTDEVHAVIIPGEHAVDVDALVRKANQRLESHQRIRKWSIWPDEDFPRTPSTLKVRRQEVARRLLSEPQPHRQPDVDLSAMSSLERVELLSELEDRYQVELDEEEFSRLTSTPELEEWLRQPAGHAAAANPPAVLSDWARAMPIRWFRTGFQQLLAQPLFRGLLPLTIAGLENLEALKPPVIFAANHTSHLDAPAILAALPRQWRQRLAPAMAQDHFRPFFEPAGFSWLQAASAGLAYFLACALYNAYPLPQQMTGARRALKYTADLVNRGYCPLVFPEGKRTPDGNLLPFRPGIGMMAVQLRIPVVPCRIKGLFEIYSIHDSWPRRGPVEVYFGRPITFASETSYEEAARRLEETVRGL